MLLGSMEENHAVKRLGRAVRAVVGSRGESQEQEGLKSLQVTVVPVRRRGSELGGGEKIAR